MIPDPNLYCHIYFLYDSITSIAFTPSLPSSLRRHRTFYYFHKQFLLKKSLKKPAYNTGLHCKAGLIARARQPIPRDMLMRAIVTHARTGAHHSDTWTSL